MEGAQFATAFDDAAREYECGRPGYSRPAIDVLARALALGRRSIQLADIVAYTIRRAAHESERGSLVAHSRQLGLVLGAKVEANQ